MTFWWFDQKSIIKGSLTGSQDKNIWDNPLVGLATPSKKIFHRFFQYIANQT